MARRYDVFTIDALERTPGGALRVEGALTRTGIFTYRNADGTERREYRPDSSVFDTKALAGFSDVAVTVGHPPNGVNADNWKAVAVGETGEAKRKDAFMVAPITVRDAATITRVENKELVELSCGYDIDYDATPGVTPEGERYDGVQTNIRGNHVALLPKGEARGGSRCSLRLDSLGDEVLEIPSKILPMTPEQLAQLQADLKAAQKRADEADGRVAVLTTQLATANDPKRLDAAVTERVELLDQARKDGVTVDAKASLRVIRVAILEKRVPGFRADGLSDDALHGAFAVTVALPHPALAQVDVTQGGRDDGGDPLEAAKKRGAEAARKAYGTTPHFGGK